MQPVIGSANWEMSSAPPPDDLAVAVGLMRSPLRYTARLSGVTRLALMMMDVLSHFDELKVCVAYELDGQRLERFPCHAEELRRCKPIYETIAGWNEPVDDVRTAEQFPAGALAYVRRIEELVGIPVGVLSVGPDRAQTIFTDAAAELALQPLA